MHRSRASSALLVLVCLIAVFSTPHAPRAVSPDIVISQVYGGGGNSGAPYTHDYIELYNRGSAPVLLSNYSLQYASATGTGNFGASGTQLTELPPATINPGDYFLVREAGGATGAPLPGVDFVDASSPIAMAAGAGKVALVSGTATLGCNGGSAPCNATQLARIVDLVGYGGANFFEGSGPTPVLSNTTAAFRQGNGSIDTDNNAADFFAATPAPRSGPAALSIGDASVAEGNTGTKALTFTVTLSKAAAVPVTYTIETADGTATAALDYAPLTDTVTIPPGTLSRTHAVTIYGDLIEEPSETFFVRLTSVAGAVSADLEALGTITNDDIPLTPIHAIQGNGGASPMEQEIAATLGVVTARKNNGFFIQTPDVDADADPGTSEGLFVFTSTKPAVAIGDYVRASGRVVEFASSSDTSGETLTEFSGSVGYEVLSSSNPLPSAVPISALTSLPSPGYPNRNLQLERYEAMLVSEAAMDVVGPTTAPNFGEFYAVVNGAPRPFREEGVEITDTLPADAPATVPRFDGNFERLMVDGNDLLEEPSGNVRQGLNVPAGVHVLNVSGVVDYAFGNYRVALKDTATVLGTREPVAVRPRAAGEFTIAGLNLENYRNPSAGRQTKAARVITEVIGLPDILGVIEVGTIADLQNLAAAINTVAGTNYAAYLRDNDGTITGSEQNTGYLIDTSRVEVIADYQEYFGKTWEIAGQTDLLHDRPPYVLKARMKTTGTPVTVIVNHLKSLIGVNSLAAFGDGTVTEGYRNREKRRLQAEDLADLIATHINDNLVVLGDMNAFDVNDGYVDVMGIVRGAPAGAERVTNFSADRWSYELTNLVATLPASERYSYVFDGNAQVLDHILVNQPMFDRFTTFQYARNNADFPEVFETNFDVTTRLSDHDAPVAYFRGIADLVTTTTMPASVMTGEPFTFAVGVANAGDDATNGTLTVSLPASASYGGVTTPSGWTCAPPAAGAVTCTAATVGADFSDSFTFTMTPSCALAGGEVLAASATVSGSTELNTTNNGSSGSAVVNNPAPAIAGAVVSSPVIQQNNHKMLDVRVEYVATDNCGVTTRLSVRSNEPVDGLGDGDTAPDWMVVNDHLVQLRAERSGTGTGRIYTITIAATDTGGRVTTQDLTVTVPH